MNKNKGFTLIELLVVVAIISVLASIIISSLNTSRLKARDAARLADMKQLRIALELFYDKYGHYPGNTYEGVSDEGEMIGDNNGPIEQALKPFLSDIPADPIHNGVVYFYSYDPVHCVNGISANGATFGFNKAEATSNVRNDTNGCGSNMNHDVADYVEALYPAAP